MTEFEREQKLGDVSQQLIHMLSSSPEYSRVTVNEFTPYGIGLQIRGLHCSVEKADSALADDIMGFLDIPAMLNGFQLEVVKSESNGSIHIFIYDDEKFHIDNIRKIHVTNVHTIFPKEK